MNRDALLAYDRSAGEGARRHGATVNPFGFWTLDNANKFCSCRQPSPEEKVAVTEVDDNHFGVFSLNFVRLPVHTEPRINQNRSWP